jgi:hypothetical protein
MRKNKEQMEANLAFASKVAELTGRDNCLCDECGKIHVGECNPPGWFHNRANGTDFCSIDCLVEFLKPAPVAPESIALHEQTRVLNEELRQLHQDRSDKQREAAETIQNYAAQLDRAEESYTNLQGRIASLGAAYESLTRAHEKQAEIIRQYQAGREAGTYRLRPWTLKEVPVGSFVRQSGCNARSTILAASEGGVWLADGKQSPSYFLSSHEVSHDQGRTWHPCGTFEKVSP